MTTWNVFGIHIAPYGTMIAIGFLMSILVGTLLAKKTKQDPMDFILVGIVGMIFGFLGAKLLYFAVSFNEIDWSWAFESMENFAVLMSSGFVFYGGLIFVLISLPLSHKLFKTDVVKLMSACIPIVPLAHGFGRIGCFFASCCYGIPYDGPLSYTYHNAMFAPNDIPLFPVQLVEAGCEFLIAIFLIIRVCRKGARFSNIMIYLTTYSVLRFILEYFRYDADRKYFGPLSTSQWISIFMLIACIVVMIVAKKKQKPEAAA